MTLWEYQEAAQRTSNTEEWGEKLVNGLLGLAGETGECCDIAKKFYFQGHAMDVAHLEEELGDVLWYVVETAVGAGLNLEDIAKKNIEKLKKRYPDGFDTERSQNRKDEGSTARA